MSDSDRAIRVGIVGLSASRGFAATTHLPALAALPGYEVRGVTSSSPERSSLAATQHGIPLTFRNAGELAASDEIDLVVIAVKVPEHDRLVRATLAAGKPVLCEWPLGTGFNEAEGLAQAAARYGVRTAVGLQAQSAPAVRFLRDLVLDGFVGEVLSSTIIGSGGGWGPEVASAADRYTVDAANGASLLSIPMGHALDAVCFVLGELNEVRASMALRRPMVHDIEADVMLQMSTPDQIAVSGMLARGGVLAAHYRGGHSRGTNLHWEINGTYGDIVVTGPSGHVQLADLELRGARGSDPALVPLAVPESYNLAPELVGQPVPVMNVGNAYAQLRSDLRSGSTVVPDFAHAARRHHLLDQIDAADRM